MKGTPLKKSGGLVLVATAIILILAACSNPAGSSVVGAGDGSGGGASDTTASYTVSYDRNGADNGEIPIGPQSYEEGQQITVLGNSGNLEKDGRSFFGWNSDPAGDSSTWYAVGATLTVTEDVTLYAQWTDAAVAALSYDPNGADTGDVPIGDNSYPQGYTVTVLDNSGDLQKQGHSFLRWNTQPDGLGVDYAPGATIVIGSEDVILYAQWTENPVFTLSYDANGADTGSIPVGPRSYEEGESITVSGNTGNLHKTDHTFAGWNDEAQGHGTQYRTGNLLVMPAENVTLYAQWNPPLAEEEDLQEAFNAVIEQTIVGDPENGFSAVEGEDGAYVYTKTGGGSLWFWQIHASGTISFEVTLEEGPGGDPSGDVEVYRVDSDGTGGELIGGTTVSAADNEPTTVQFDIPDSDFQIDFQGGQRVWVIRDFTLTLDD